MKDDSEKLGMQLGCGLITSMLVAAALALPAVYWLVLALHEALTTGTVQVNPASRRTPRAWVPWPQAWAHLTGLVLIVVGGLSMLWAVLSPSQRPSSWVGYALLTSFIASPTGLVLWYFSGSLTTVSGALYMLGFFSFVGLMWLIDTRLGRRFTWMALLAFGGALLFYASRL